MDEDITFYDDALKNYIHIVENNKSDKEALAQVSYNFMKVYELIKMIMISKKDRYYGCFLMNLELEINYSSCCEAGVSVNTYPFKMQVNPLLLGSRSLSEMTYIFCHEIEHLVLNHPAEALKINPEKDPAIKSKLNIAMDASINDRLNMDCYENEFHTISEPEGIITSDYLVSRYYIHLKQLQAFDYYYERIPDEISEGGEAVIDSDEIGRILSKVKNQIITKQDLGNNRLIILHKWSGDDNANNVEALIKKYVEDTYEGMPDNIRGNLPDHQKEALNKIISPPVKSWKNILKRYIGTIPSGYRKTRMRLNRRQPERYDISGKISNRIIKLIVAIDTSGSVSVGQLKMIFNEIFGIIGTRMCEITIIECDAEIQKVYKAKCNSDISFEVEGRGGTSYIPVINYINDNRYFRDAILVYFTDGFGDKKIPRPLTYKNLWVLTDEKEYLSVENPYGEVLVID